MDLAPRIWKIQEHLAIDVVLGDAVGAGDEDDGFEPFDFREELTACRTGEREGVDHGLLHDFAVAFFALDVLEDDPGFGGFDFADQGRRDAASQSSELAFAVGALPV